MPEVLVTVPHSEEGKGAGSHRRHPEGEGLLLNQQGEFGSKLGSPIIIGWFFYMLTLNILPPSIAVVPRSIGVSPIRFPVGPSPWCQAIAGTIFKLAFGPCVGVRFGRCGMSEVLWALLRGKGWDEFWGQKRGWNGEIAWWIWGLIWIIYSNPILWINHIF